MSRLILLIVGAAWLAVLLPPLFRSRVAPGPVSSVSAFRHQLRSLQGGPAPMRHQMPMRSMARPLAPSGPARRPAQPRRAAPPRRPEMDDPRHLAGRGRLHEGDPMFDQPAPRARRAHHGGQGEQSSSHQRRMHYAAGPSLLSPQEMVRRRRVNVLYSLIGVNALSLFLAFSMGSTGMTVIFAVAALALIGYCYTLVQIRHQASLRRYYDYYRAA